MSCYSKQWIRDLLLYVHVSMGLDARRSFVIADSRAKLCPHENPRFADNGAFKLAVIGYDHLCRECHSESCVTGEIFCCPSSSWENVVENCGGFS